MKFAGAGVGVIDAADAVFIAQQFVEFGDVGRQVVHVHGGVFDDLARFGVADDVAHQSLACAAQFPDFVAIGIPQNRHRVTVASLLPSGGHSGHCGLGCGAGVSADFHHQHRARITDHE